MEQKTKSEAKEILVKLAKLQADIEYIKQHIQLEEETQTWEKVSAEDSANFFEKHNL
jgi:hypothetical protein